MRIVQMGHVVADGQLMVVGHDVGHKHPVRCASAVPPVVRMRRIGVAVVFRTLWQVLYHAFVHYWQRHVHFQCNFSSNVGGESSFPSPTELLEFNNRYLDIAAHIAPGLLGQKWQKIILECLAQLPLKVADRFQLGLNVILQLLTEPMHSLQHCMGSLQPISSSVGTDASNQIQKGLQNDQNEASHNSRLQILGAHLRHSDHGAHKHPDGDGVNQPQRPSPDLLHSLRRHTMNPKLASELGGRGLVLWELVRVASERFRSRDVSLVDHTGKLGEHMPDAVGHLLQELAANVEARAFIQDLSCLAQNDTEWDKAQGGADHTSSVLEDSEIVNRHFIRCGVSPNPDRDHVRLHVPPVDPDSEHGWKQREQSWAVRSAIDFAWLRSSENRLRRGIQRIERWPSHESTMHGERQAEFGPRGQVATGVILCFRIHHG
mmetsp:Transcript_8475/g.20249  ORF Transcript_8475/g.20249 Transcript_8475/m.20249 type:complete len:432 (+) Transcript_8475:364-1659(+)